MNRWHSGHQGESLQQSVGLEDNADWTMMAAAVKILAESNKTFLRRK
jgi:hypothetical protein